jgi:polygalacturonase
MIFFNGHCGRVLIQDLTLQNPPKMHVVFKGADNNITVQGITINTTAADARQHRRHRSGGNPLPHPELHHQRR